jgi:glycerol-3-phosphate acyltransferase PlsY
MEAELVLAASIVGYLIGSISFARIVARFVSPATDATELGVIPGDQDGTTMQLASATTIGTKLGSRYGMLVALLDTLKVLIPSLVCKVLIPEQPVYLVLATAAMIGHIWPVFFGFKGGRGISAAVGGMLAVDPLGVLFMWLLGFAVGFMVRSVFVVFMGGVWFFIPWVWLRWHEPVYVAFAVVVNLIFIIAVLPEALLIRKQKGQETAASFDELMEFTPMGKGLLKMARRMHLYK